MSIVSLESADEKNVSASILNFLTAYGVISLLSKCGGSFGAKVWHSTDKYRRTSYNGLVERYEKAKARFDEVTATIAQRSAKGERLRREASPFRGRGSSGHLRRRWSLRVQKRRILRLPRTSTSVCVGGRVR